MDQSSEDFAQIKPGKPYSIGDPSIDKIKITWEIPKDHLLTGPIGYDLRYRNVTGERASGWIPYKERLYENILVLDNWPPDSKFVFKVRMVDADDEESLFSDQSDEINTLMSAACIMFPDLQTEITKKGSMLVKVLPFRKDDECTNSKAKSRKLFLGNESKLSSKEKTIMIVGPTGAGKSTLVDGIMNYIFGVSWTDSFRLTVGNLEPEEKENTRDQTVSQTVWITCYTIHPRDRSKIPYKLTIVDTPGIGHSRGIEGDQEITDQIRELFTAKDKKGLLYLDAVCFVVKAPDIRLTKTQEYIFNSMKSVFQRDIIENFCLLITFSDGKQPAILPALAAAGLLVEPYFSFNNSALFANNKSEDKSELQRSIWDWNMGCKGFEEFFQKLEKFESKSLALSTEVLLERKNIEITVDNLRKKLDAAMKMSLAFTEEIKVMEENADTIEKNKDFEYFVDETFCVNEIATVYNLNCNICKETCHKHCWTFNFQLSIWTCDVFKRGNCNQCDGKCSAINHINEKKEYKYKTKKVKKTYDEMKKKYDEANEKKLSHKELIAKMEEDIKHLDNEIQEMNEKIIRSTNRLKEIALCDDPISATEHYDLMIWEEKTIKKKGWMDRVKGLLKFKQTAVERACTFHTLKETCEVLKDVKKQFSVFRQKMNYETDSETD